MANINAKFQRNFVLVVLVIILAASVVVQWIFTSENRSDLPADTSLKQEDVRINQGQKISDSNSVKIDFGNGRNVEKQISAKTAYEALTKVASSQKFNVEAKEYKYGLMVEEINKIRNSESKFWSYYVNGKPGQIASDRYNLSPGDVVEWKYISAK